MPHHDSQRKQLLSDVQKARIEWFNERYHIATTLNFGSGSQKTHLGHGEARVCRYCGKDKSSTTFKKIAHAVPEHVGNKWLLDVKECDLCNKHFADMLEDDFSKWTQIWRSFGRVKGKKYPSIRTPDNNFQMKVDAPNFLTMTIAQENSNYIVDGDKKTLSVSIPRQSYIPMGVFKCLVKMALAIMPKSEESRCGHLRDWILQEQHTRESYPYSPLLVFRQFISGPVPNDSLSLDLLLRKSDGPQDCPYMQFALSFSNLILQIALPMHMEDSHLLGKDGCITIQFWPHLWDGTARAALYGESEDIEIDMSGTSAVNDNCDLKLQFEKVEHSSIVDQADQQE